jgi:hypothetical protein
VASYLGVTLPPWKFTFITANFGTHEVHNVKIQFADPYRYIVNGPEFHDISYKGQLSCFAIFLTFEWNKKKSSVDFCSKCKKVKNQPSVQEPHNNIVFKF